MQVPRSFIRSVTLFSISSILLPKILQKQLTHIINSVNYSVLHIIKSFLHLLQKVLDEGVQFLSSRIIRNFIKFLPLESICHPKFEFYYYTFRMEQSTTSITQQQQQQRLLYPPYQYFFHHSQLNQSKAKVLASLQQIGYEVEQFQDKPINDIMKVADQTLKKSYTVKLVAVKDGEIGVLSRRVEMKDRHRQNEPKQSLLSQNGQSYVINNYFYPKHLKALKKAIDPREEEQKQKLFRWQAEQYEKMKGKALDLLPDLDDEAVKPFEDPKIHSNKLVIAGLGALKRREKGFVLPNVKRLQMGQMRRDETDEQRAESQPLPGQEQKKLSYSRLLADLTERDLPIPVQKLAIETVSQHPPQATMIKPGGVILELDEENENSPDGAAVLQMKLPSLSQSKKNYKLPKNDSDNLQKRIRKFQDKLID